MKFTIKKTFKLKTFRLGQISELKNNENLTLETPMLLLHTQGGHVPHLTHQLLKLITKYPQILQIPMASLYCHLEALKLHNNGCISDFIGNKECITCIVLQDPSDLTRQGHNGKEKVSLFTKYGKVMFDSEKYMNIIELLKPDMYCLLSDGDTNDVSPQKRLIKSVENTVAFNQQCLKRHKQSKVLQNSLVIAPISGGYCLKSRQRCLNGIFHDNINGYLIDGLHNNGPEVELLNFNKVEPIVQWTIKNIPEDKFRMIFGCWHPINIIKLIKCGIDIFDTSYCKILSDRSAALTFSFNDDDDTDLLNDFEINLLDNQYMEDFQPILKQCQCLVCVGYTRAYIHHLLIVQELLGPILLMIHNVHHLLKFFETIRYAIAADRNLEELECKVEKQFNKKKN